MATVTTTAYAVIDMTTGITQGVFDSVSERGAKSKAAKVTGIPFHYLTATVFVPVEKLETTVAEDDGYAWVEVSYGDESDHWTEKISVGGDITKAVETAREYIAKGYGTQVGVVQLVAIPSGEDTLSKGDLLISADSPLLTDFFKSAVMPEPLEGSVSAPRKGWLADPSMDALFTSVELELAEPNMTCGVCGGRWNDKEVPTPAARCPFEYDHDDDDAGDDDIFLTYNPSNQTVTYSDGRVIPAHPSFVAWVNAE